MLTCLGGKKILIQFKESFIYPHHFFEAGRRNVANSWRTRPEKKKCKKKKLARKLKIRLSSFLVLRTYRSVARLASGLVLGQFYRNLALSLSSKFGEGQIRLK